jgi:hypothetical protein
MVAPIQPAQPGIISTPEACQLIMISRQRLDQIVADGWIARQERGQIKVTDLVQGYIRYLLDRERRQSQKAGDNRVRDARVYDLQVKTAERLGRLVDVEELFYLANTLAGLVRTEHVGAGARITRDRNQRRSIDREMNAIDQRLADRIEALTEGMQDGRKHPAPAQVHAAGRMGDGESDLPAVGRDTGAA